MNPYMLGFMIGVVVVLPFVYYFHREQKSVKKDFDTLLEYNDTLQTKYEEQKKTFHTLGQRYIDLKDKHKTLNEKQDDLQSKHFDLENNYAREQRNVADIQRQFGKLQQQHDELLNEYDAYRDKLYLESRDEGWRKFALDTERLRQQRDAEARGELKFFHAIDTWQEYTPEEFLDIRSKNMHENDPGIYIIHNKTKNIYYVGQGDRVIHHAKSHFTGGNGGNADVYADYKYHDAFTVKIVALLDSGYDTLDEFERAGIRFYNAYTEGYNKTSGPDAEDW